MVSCRSVMPTSPTVAVVQLPRSPIEKGTANTGEVIIALSCTNQVGRTEDIRHWL